MILETEHSTCEWREIESVERYGTKVRRFERAGYVRVRPDDWVNIEERRHYVVGVHCVKEWMREAMTVEVVSIEATNFGNVKEGVK